VAKVTVISNPSFWSLPFLLRNSAIWKSTLTLSLLLFTAYYSAAQERGPTEYQVESAYLYNFGKFVTFPPDRASTFDLFQICVIGKDPFGATLDATLQGGTIGGKKISAQRISNMQQAQSCSILFISSSEEGHIPAILKDASRLNLLTVSEVRHFAEQGGIIELVKQQDKIRFEVNLTAAQESHLTLSSELLKVAIRVLRKDVKGS
jgi:hypothetical protein